LEEEEKEETLELEAEDIDSIKRSLEEEKAKAERYLSNWQRAEADFDNYRKRTEQEKSETARFANSLLILNLLPVLDDFERAFNSLSLKLAQLSWVDGIRLIHRKLQAILEARGLSEISSVGESFDPTVHEAVTQGEGEEGKVIEELQKGYKLHDRVIRPALVVVGKGKEEEKKEEGEKPDESVD
jgi:molecular chaperone GrpE